MALEGRPSAVEKHQWGAVTVMAGSDRYPGAAVLVVEGASRTGVDAVSFVGPRRAAEEVLRRNPSSPNTAIDRGAFAASDLGGLPHLWDDVIVIGPGIGQEDDVTSFVEGVITRATRAVVLDADAIGALRTQRKHRVPIVVTPNHKEFHRLTGHDVREDTVASAAREFSVTILAKGEVDIISDGQRTAHVEGGSIYLAKDGTGDVLAGIVGALVARENDHFEACRLSALVMKDAGARAFKKYGQGMVASDIPDCIDTAVNLDDA
jgi:NAD(P)H-hydrate epimerase